MIKKIILALLVISLIFFCIKYYNSQRTVECWWGVLYPSISNVGFEDEDTSEKISSSDASYMPSTRISSPTKIKIALVEWFKNLF